LSSVSAMKKNIYEQIKKFFEQDIWKISVKDKHPVFSFFVRQGRIIFIASKGFNRDKIQLRASALSFYTLLSIVPVLAMVFGISKGFGLENYLKNILTERFSGHQEVLDVLMGFVDKYLGRINEGFLTGIGLIILFWSVLKVFGNIESSFNNIWQIKKSRMFTRQFTDYISLLIIAPVLLIITSSFNVSQLASVSESLPFLHYLDTFLKILVRILSLTLIWFVFTLIYIIIPNTKVRFIPALIAGIIAGTLFQLLQWGYVNFQSLLSSYGAIYGTFAALPLFMMWLELSWLITLVGAEISYAYQNAASYEQEAQGVQVSQKNRRALVLLVAHRIIKAFTEGKPPMNADDIASQLAIPVRLVRDIIYDLINAKIINEIYTQEIREIAYQPALDPAKITISYVIDAIDNQGQYVIFDTESTDHVKFNSIIDSFYDDVRNSPKNTALKEL
jgi:membrane protein